MHKNLQKLGFNDEYEIIRDINANKNFVDSVPTKNGVYVILAYRDIPRLVSESKILYVGRSSNLRKRIKYLLKYYLPSGYAGNWGRHTAREALGKIIENTDIKPSISYVICNNYKELETKLIQSYCKQHIETSPLNNQRK